MISLDTHIWIWWVNGDPALVGDALELLQAHENSGLAVSAISCWEVAEKVESGKLDLDLDRPVANWMERALGYPGIRLIQLSPAILVDSTQLPLPFHRDPADQMLVATSRVEHIPLLTADERIKAYPHVELAE